MGMLLVLLSSQHTPIAAADHPLKNAPASTLVFAPPAGVYTNSVTVQVKVATPATVARYTLDGADPDDTSPVYADPIEITGDTLLKVKTFKADGTGAATVSQAYVVIDPALGGFNSNLPLIILDSYGHKMSHDQKAPVSVRVIDVQGGRSRLAGPAEIAGVGELNIRGNTSMRFPKKSYHLKTLNDANEPLKAPLLGLPKEHDWVLYAPYVDKTMLRDVLGYELSNAIGRYAARTRFVEVFLNENGGHLSPSHYRGVYVLVEKIKRDKNRVPIAKLGPEDNTEPNVSGGYIFKKDHTERADTPEGFVPMMAQSLAARQQRFVSSQGTTFFYVEPKPAEITPAQRAWLRRYINTFEKNLYGENFRDPKTGYPAYLDVDSFIDHHWLVELSKNIDGFRFSTFFHKDRGGKIYMGPIWDWNLTFGNATPREGFNPEGWYWPQLDDQQYSWFRRLFEDPDFAQRYADRWGELRANQFSVAHLHARIDYWAGVLAEAQARNYKRWRILGEHVWPNNFVGQSYDEEIDYLKQWVEKRYRWIDGQFLRAPALSPPAGPLERGAKVEIKARRGEVYYTLDGTDPRAPGGEPSGTAKTYRGSIALDQSAKIVCRMRQEGRWSPPTRAAFTVNSASAKRD